ncbi:MAG TPA: hypothetical protein VIV63_03115 [Steroidobacteraceae bacterium]
MRGWAGIGPIRHDHPHRFAVDHQVADPLQAGTGIAANEQFLARNLNYFDAIFFFGVREIDLDAQQRADLLSFRASCGTPSGCRRCTSKR